MAPLNTLQTIEASVWQELAAAALDKGHAWRCAVLATIDGDSADARSVVLREVDATQRELIIFTDARSAKVAQLQAHPRATLVLWSPTLLWQLRLRVLLAIETSGLALSSRWASLQFSPAANDYLARLAPGTPLAEARVERDSREHFAVLTAKVNAIDWLEINPAGHRRALFDDQGARWLVP